MKKAKLLYKLGGFLAPLAIATPLFVSARCKADPEYKRFQVVTSFNSPFKPKPNEFDQSESYGSMEALHLHNRATFENLIRIATEKESKVEFDVKQKKYVIKSPSIWYKKLALADAIIVVKNDGTKVTFDSDEHEIVPQPLTDGTYELESMHAKSAKDNSINSQKFEDELNDKNTKQILFTIREGVKWVDGRGNAICDLKADDFYYSWWRTILLNTHVRHLNGGSDEIDKALVNTMSGVSTKFTKETSYNNEYLYELFNIKSSDFKERDKFIQKVQKNGREVEALAINKNISNGNSGFSNFISNLLDSMDFIPAPSEFIKKHVNDPVSVFKYTNGDAEVAKANEKIKTATGKVKEVGAYWYGNNINSTLFIGPYYYDQDFGKANQIRLKANLNYFDKNFVNNKKKVKTVLVKYKSKQIDPSVFNTQQWDDYKSGLVTSYPFGWIKNEELKKQILQNPKKYGLKYKKSYQRNKTQTLLSVSALPSPFIIHTEEGSKKQSIDKYEYNDVYAQLLYGQTLEQIHSGKVTFNSEYVYGTGLKFRTLVNSAINFEYLQNLINESSSAWLAKVAPHSSISTIDSDNPIKYEDKINVYYGIKNDLTKTEVVTKSEAFKYTQNHPTTPAYSPVYDVVKVEIKKLLDDFYAAKGITNDKKVEWSIVYPYLNISETYQAAYAKYIEVIKSLDPRLEIKLITPVNVPEIYNTTVFGSVNVKRQAWSYDYDGLTSGLDGYSWSALIIPQLSFLYSQEKANPGDAQLAAFYSAFPAIKKLVKSFKKWYDENTSTNGLQFKPSLPFEKWHLIENEHVLDFADVLPYAKEEAGEIVFANPATEPASFDPYSLSANFWASYQTEATTEELLELTHELSNHIGFLIDTEQGLSKNGNIPVLTDSHYIIPTLPFGNIIYSYGDVIIEQDK